MTGARSQFGTIRSTGAAGLRPPSPLVRLHGWRKREVRAGFTLVELVIVFAIIAILVALAVPSLSGLTRVSSEGAIRTTMRSLFASARMRAAATQRYVGIRFQQARDGRQYAVMLEQVQPGEHFPGGCPRYYQNCTFLTFTAAGGSEPIPLPRGVEVARGDLETWKPRGAGGTAPAQPDMGFVEDPNGVPGVIPATTFTVVFSPSGQIVRRQVHVTQRPDQYFNQPDYRMTWWDPVFSLTYTLPNTGVMFPPDVKDQGTSANTTNNTDPDPDPPSETICGGNPTQQDLGFYDISQNSLWVYEQQKRIETGAAPFRDYIARSGVWIPLNIYTGAPVNTQQ